MKINNEELIEIKLEDVRGIDNLIKILDEVNDNIVALKMDFHRIFDMTYNDFSDIIIKKFPNLKYLHLHFYYIEGDMFDITKFTNLEFLFISQSIHDPIYINDMSKMKLKYLLINAWSTKIIYDDNFKLPPNIQLLSIFSKNIPLINTLNKLNHKINIIDVPDNIQKILFRKSKINKQYMYDDEHKLILFNDNLDLTVI
jgi:hypothetical protein